MMITTLIVQNSSLFSVSATPFNKISKIDTHLDDDSGSVKRDFNDFIASVMGHMSDVVERQENFILQ